MTTNQEVHFTVTEAAERLGISASQVRRLFDRGDLAGVRDWRNRRLIAESAFGSVDAE